MGKISKLTNMFQVGWNHQLVYLRFYFVKYGKSPINRLFWNMFYFFQASKKQIQERGQRLVKIFQVFFRVKIRKTTFEMKNTGALS